MPEDVGGKSRGAGKNGKMQREALKKQKNVKKWAQKQKNGRRIFQNVGECKRMLGEELNLPKMSKIDVAKL